jgi:hypothetical protein
MADRVAGGGGPKPVPRPQSPEDRLDSWKQIATYLDRSIRTVQQWERSENLPVYRLRHSKSGSVYAFRSELDRWRVQRTAVAGLPETPVPKPSSEIQPATAIRQLGRAYRPASKDFSTRAQVGSRRSPHRSDARGRECWADTAVRSFRDADACRVHAPH